ncbi:hypothetical protein Tco_0400207 [Tanacetum coccineum]
MKKTNSDIQYAVSIKEDTTYMCLHFTKDHEGNKINTPYPKSPICRIQVIECEDSKRYQTWSLLQEISIRQLGVNALALSVRHPTYHETPIDRVVHYKEFGELIQPFKDPERVSQLDRKLLKKLVLIVRVF